MKALSYTLLFFIVLLAGYLRFHDLGNIPRGLHGDEAEFGIIQRNVLSGNYDNFFSLGNHGQYFDFSILSYAVQGFFHHIFESNIFGLRSSSALIGTLTIPAFYFLAQIIFKNYFISLIFSLALATSHWHIAYSRLAINNIWTPFFLILFSYFLLKAFQKNKLRNYILAGAVMGVSLYFAHANRVIPLIVFSLAPIILIMDRKHIRENIIGILLLFLTAITVYFPQALYYFKNPESFGARTDEVSIFNHLPEYMERYMSGSVSEILFWQFINTIKVFNFGGDIGFYFYGYQGGLLAPVLGVLMLIGFPVMLYYFKTKESILIFTSLSAIIILGGVLTIDAPSSQRILGALPFLILIAGYPIKKLTEFKSISIIILISILFTINSFSDYKIYFLEYSNSTAGWAQREPATQIARYLQSKDPMKTTVYMLRENTWLYFKHGTIRYLNPNLQGYDVDVSSEYIPLDTVLSNNSIFIMPPESKSLGNLRLYYPYGISKIHYNKLDNSPAFISFEIDHTKTPGN